MRPISATYRIQFSDTFSFRDAQQHIPYLAALGISHVYASPVFAARPGSQHGYDVTDPTLINPELGGEPAFRSFVAALHQEDLGLILDIVPNHMAADTHNPYWFDLLAFGQAGPSAGIFDIDWTKPRILLPILGEDPGALIKRGNLAIALDEAKGQIVIRHFDTPLPLSAASTAQLLERAGLAELAPTWALLDKRAEPAPIGTAREGLRSLTGGQRRKLDEILSAADLASLLDEQLWQLAPWQSAGKELSYRRFFNITDLVGVRVEDPAVFELVHRLPIALVKDGSVDGLRVDHVDGLADPESYCERLRAAIGDEPLLVLEKILEADEDLRPWPVDGTTGYERLNDINGLFVDKDGYRTLDRHLAEQGWQQGSPSQRLAKAKRQMLEGSFGSEMGQLVTLAREAGIEGGPEVVRSALLALLVEFPVYRSYITDRGADERDRELWVTATSGLSGQAETAVATAIATIIQAGGSDAARLLRTRFQQLSGPAMAKGLEDTDFYRSVALTSANEVGGDLNRPARSVEEFHAKNLKVPARRDLVPLATHDTKRGAETRARIDMLSWEPDVFIAAFEALSRQTAGLVKDDAPDGIDRWLIIQTLIGTWPISDERLSLYLQKAMREAKRHTNWEQPDESYEAGVQAYAKALLDGPQGEGFRGELEAFVRPLQAAARVIGIAQTALQLTIPGTPDIYQGSEFWDHTLVDPDNRRPFDWHSRNEALSGRWPETLEEDHLGASKLRVMQRLLALRRSQPGLFQGSDYVPLALADGPQRWIGFERRSADGSGALLIAVPTRTTGLGSASSPEMSVSGLPGGLWEDAITGREITIEGGSAHTLSGAWPFVIAFRPA